MSTQISQSNFGGLSALAAGLAASCPSTHSLGENGAVEHGVDFLTDVNDLLVAINNYATHDKSESYYGGGFADKIGPSLETLNGIVTDPTQREHLRHYLFRIMAHTRDCRKEGMGRGSREPTMYMFVKMYTLFPEWRVHLKAFLHPWSRHYGSLGDIPRLWKYVETFGLDKTSVEEIHQWIVEIFVELIDGMQKQIANTGKPFDLTAKYAPREGKQFNKLAVRLATEFFKDRSSFAGRKAYRKMLANANRLLDTTEVKMCGHEFSEIDYAKVPGRCLTKNRLAWQNLNKDGCTRSYEDDRVEAAEKYHAFLESLKAPDSKGAKGTSMFITEICQKLLHSSRSSDDTLFTAQFNDQVKNLTECAEKNDVDLGEFLSNFVMLLDFSGSMQGEPMNLAFSMAALLGPLMKGPFKDKFLSFQSRPSWVDMSSADSVKGKLKICARSPWGGTTNFVSAHQSILDILKAEAKRGATKDEVKDMLPRFFLVVSDMQYDAACGMVHSTGSSRWATTHQTLRNMYHTAGMDMFGEPMEMPTMVYWNARTDTKGMPVVASTPGALMVTGYSSAIVKTFLTAGIEAMTKFSPWAYLKETLNNEWYDKAVQGAFKVPDGTEEMEV